jgi:hypothetical protein
MDQNGRNRGQTSRNNLLRSAQIVAIKVSGCGCRSDLEELRFDPVNRQHLLPGDQRSYDSFISVPVSTDRSVGAELLARGGAVADSVRSILKGWRKLSCAAFEQDGLSQLYAEIEEGSANVGTAVRVESGTVSELCLWMDVIDGLNELKNILTMYAEIDLEGARERWCEWLEVILGDVKLVSGLASSGEE